MIGKKRCQNEVGACSKTTKAHNDGFEGTFQMEISLAIYGTVIHHYFRHVNYFKIRIVNIQNDNQKKNWSRIGNLSKNKSNCEKTNEILKDAILRKGQK